MSLTLEQAQQLLLIDRDNLDDECVRYASLMYDIGTECAISVSERDEAKMIVEQTYANLARQKRADAERNSIKLTEAKVEELVRTDDEYIEANNEYLEKKRNCDLWYSMRDSFASKGKMVVEVCNLFLAGYFGDKVIKSSESTEQVGYDSARKKLSEERNKKERSRRKTK